MVTLSVLFISRLRHILLKGLKNVIAENYREGKVTRVKLVYLHYISINTRLRFRLMLITALLLTIATGVVAAQSGGGGGSDLVGIIESIIQFLQSIADIFSA